MTVKRPTMRCWTTLLAVLILTMLFPICRTGSTAIGQTTARTAPPDTTSRMILTPESTLRESAALIDELDRSLGFALNRIAERDSVINNLNVHWQGQYDQVYQWGKDGWDAANSWWNKHESAFWSILGMLAAAWALN
jgi:hypothetical protein